MLKILTEQEGFSDPCVLLLGGFDGIHIGHRSLVEAAKKYRLPVGLTSICGAKSGGDLFVYSEREKIYAGAGLAFVNELPFTDRLRNTSPEDFIRDIARRFCLRAIVCGDDFRFGKNAAGTPELLKSIVTCPVEVLRLMKVGGEKVSASTVKRFLSEGSMSEANALLATPFFVAGRVEQGRRVGRKLGFPTVNISYPKGKFPIREGVYGGYVATESGIFPSIVNFGCRPTFGVDEYKIEAYLDGFEGDLYGTEIEVYPAQYYRPVQKFADAEALKAQIDRDKRRLRDDQVRTER